MAVWQVLTSTLPPTLDLVRRSMMTELHPAEKDLLRTIAFVCGDREGLVLSELRDEGSGEIPLARDVDGCATE
jgi:hypothetical protein